MVTTIFFVVLGLAVVALGVVLVRRGSTGGGRTDEMRDAGRPAESYKHAGGSAGGMGPGSTP